MKKFLMFLMASVLLFGASSCTSCNKEKQKMETMVENTIKSDLAYMCENYGCMYTWYEADILLNEFLDDEDCTGTVYGITNVFQVIVDEDSLSGTSKVIMITHTADVMQVKEVEGLWIEDCALDTSKIGITYRQAYQRLMEANYDKPHSKNCILREPLGPYSCNPQYVFGNIHEPIFVDAVTGNVVNTNPAFIPKE